MKQPIKKYLEGNIEGRDYLLDSIKKLHNYSISDTEAVVLLYKKYGKTSVV